MKRVTDEDRGPLTTALLLRRPLGFITVLALGLNGIVGIGIFMTPPMVASAVPGRAGALLYLAVACACAPIALTYARLASILPADGGPALYVRHAFGRRAGSAVGIVAWTSAVLSTAAVTRGLGEQVASRLHVNVPVASVLACVVFASFNLLGLRPSAWVWTTLTVVKLAPLFVLAGLGLTRFPPHASVASASPLSVSLSVAAFEILFSLQGFEVISLPAGQTTAARRAVPAAILTALFSAALLYAALHLAFVAAAGALPATASAGLVDAARILGGESLATTLAAAVSVSLVGVVLGMHVMTPRYLAASRDRLDGEEHEVPSALHRSRNLREGITPAELLLTALPVALLAYTGALGALMEASSIAVLVQYLSAALSLVALSRGARQKQAGGPAQVRRWLLGDVVLGALAASLAIGMLLQARRTPLLGTLAVMLVGWALSGFRQRTGAGA